ncbi:MAG: hypothetical protein LC687_00110 [Actinobacteria bacterium]|nr:hypothetical protein [Actinomycetota bacterium]
MSKEVCGVCTFSKEDHESPEIHHEFNTAGKLVPKKKVMPPSPAASLPLLPLSRLLVVLERKGVLTEDELTWILSGHGATSPDDGQSRVIGDYPARATTRTG